MDYLQKEIRIRKLHSVFIFISCCLIMILHIGFINSIGTLFTDVMATFNNSRAETAVIQSTTLAISLGSGIFTGALINRIGLMGTGVLGSLVASLGLISCFFASSVTYLIISVGVFSGFGFSCGFISSAAIMSQHFSGKKRYIFLSIHATGAGIGGMVYSYLMRYLSDLYGFRGALVIIGAISMNTVPGCILWKQNSNNNKLPRCVADSNQIIEFQTRFQVKTEYSGEVIMIEKLRQNSSLEASDTVYVKQYPVQHGETKTKTVIVQGTENTSFTSNKSKSGQTFCKNISQILRNRSFLFYVMGMVISAPSLTVVFIFVADIYLDNGMTNDDVSLGLLLMNVLSITGRLFPGIILQSKYIPSLLLPFLNAMLSAVLVFCFAFVKSRWHIIILSGAVGVPLGMSISMLT
ncbi:monocarboxylate transporter 7-like [Mercenaria mercenaria]|uniref:monocarboxylate transporter 7-like n=1 Tax=Mercenaria mercenaria TaxID=6596 RepID=UPI00234E8DFA|nr:monocarboxylate transporter 7-like [Mercenaria mercenaria]